MGFFDNFDRIYYDEEIHWSLDHEGSWLLTFLCTFRFMNIEYILKYYY